MTKKIDKRNIQDILGLTAMQEGMLFHYLSSPRSQQYFEQIRLGLSGDIDIPRFKETWNIVGRANEMLRAVIRWEKLEEPVQIVLRDKEIPVKVVDLSQENEENQARILEKGIRDDRDEPIDLTREPLRVILFLLNPQRGEMLITFHHIVFDGWSSGILLKELVDVYRRLRQLNRGRKPAVPQKTGYKEFIKWYRSLDPGEMAAFWKDYLQGFDTRTLLPYDRGRVEEVSRVQTHRLEMAPPSQNITLATLMFSAWGILLQKYNNSDDILFGTTVSGRTPRVAGVEDIVGLFINTLPLRLKAHGENTAGDVFRRIGTHLKERSAHGFEQASLTEIKKFTGIGNDSDLFDSIVVIDNYPLDGIESGDHLNPLSYELFEMTNFDLTVQVLPSGARPTLEICFHYNADVFESETIRRMARHFFNILQAVTRENGSAKKLSQIVMTSEEEERRILFEFNDPDILYLGDKTIHRIIEEQAARTPHNDAVQFEGASVTYNELDRRADQVAHMLRERGVRNGSRVALMFPRSIQMIISVLGILKAGAACIPLDITYPHERNSFIIEDSGAKFLLIHPGIQFQHSAGSADIFYDEQIIDACKPTRLDDSVKPGDLSYIIYTSGSTGKPKGALLNHWGIVNHTNTKIDVLGIGETDIVGNNFSINVIASIWQILAPLFTGAKLVLYSDEIEWDPYAQFRLAAKDRVTVIEVIPPVLKAFLFLLEEGKEPVNLDRLRRIALTSEETKPFLVNKFYERYKKTRLVDCYGQTENSDDILHHTIPFDTDTQKVPIGTPALNTQVLILNHHNQLQPVGIVGEICSSGAGVGLGYWNRPEMSAEKFTANPLNPKVRMYRTGDLGKWLTDGQVEFLGRIDHQVKIRGNRVELREIENHVIRFQPVKEAAVIAKEDNEGDLSLYAFFESGREITASEIREYLLKTLPDYMVPAHFVPMAKIPVTPNGKIDRKALAKVEVKGTAGAGAPYKPPRSDYERKIEAIWCKLLEKEKIGTDDNFFDLGGHSLLLIKLKSRLERTFDREISIVQLFNYPTIDHQARYFDGTLTESAMSNGTGNTVSPEEEKEKESGGGIAVIGMTIRVPGAKDIRQFWDNIFNGVESISFFDEDELEGGEVEGFVRAGSKVIPAGGILGDIDLFDADFFGFNPREAEIIDPQQRL
ncbi:MAG: amino acid adenylation domain-containing protein, partial [bacterium]|nr:amino acid adenylation domain-containing protein [bacterium]